MRRSRRTAGDDSAAAPFEKHTIPYPDGYDTMSSGASCYDGMDDHFGSPYFSHLDVYNMTSTDTLTIIPNFETYQQTTEYTCGAASTLMVLNQYGVTDYDEMKIAEMSDTTEDNGINPQGLVKFFDAIGLEFGKQPGFPAANTPLKILPISLHGFWSTSLPKRRSWSTGWIGQDIGR